MKKYQEVEVKYKLYNPDRVRAGLEEVKAIHSVKDEIQKDTYYMPCHRNFLENEIVSEWLRVRETNGKCSINFKQWLPIGAKIQNQCNEYETFIADPAAMHQILEKLDFISIVVVEKRRNSWMYDSVEISIDDVHGLGSFIELEAVKKIEDSEIDKCLEHFGEILQAIGAEVGMRDRRGYPYQLLKKRNNEEMKHVF